MLSAFKNFLVTFLVAALIFGTVGFFTSRYVSGIVSGILDGDQDELDQIISATPEDTTSGGNDAPSVDLNQKVPEGSSFTLLFIGTDYRPDVYNNYFHSYADIDELTGGLKDAESTVGILKTPVRRINATWLVLLRADKENREYVISYISPETCVSTPAGDAALGDVYGRYGSELLCEYVETMTQLRIDHSFIVDGINGSDFISSMGSVNIEVKHDIYSAGAYHVSSATSVVTEEESTVAPESESESKDDKKTEEADKKDNKKSENDDPEEASAEKTVDNVLVLKAGGQSLSDYSVHILNTFKELSLDDINVKSAYMLDIAEQYLRRCASWSEEELTAKLEELSREQDYSAKPDKDEDGGDTPPENAPVVNGSFNDPYASKPVLATDLVSEELREMLDMLKAVEYFNVTKYVYPGSYSEQSGLYMPDSAAALEFFAKYSAK